jgi:hypothetical protein
MSRDDLFTTMGVLLLLEVITCVWFKISSSRVRRIADRLLAGRDFASLDEAEREELEAQASLEHEKTFYRKVDQFCILFHLPGLASWGIITGRDTTPPLYSMTVSFLFWLAVAWVVG